MHWIRRGHLYFGLFLFPWALLYGVTAFLFNHPSAFSDQKVIHFDRTAYLPEENQLPVSAEPLALEVLKKLNALQNPKQPYEVGAAPAKFNREFAFATFRSDSREYNLLFDLRTGAGTIRAQPPRPVPTENVEQAPFAVGAAGQGNELRGQVRRGTPRSTNAIANNSAHLETGVKSALLAAIPQICQSAGLECQELTITSIPELDFPLQVDGAPWIATYQPLTGVVSGRRDVKSKEGAGELGFRRFLLRLHTAHGYPSDGGVRAIWAVVVDLMAFVMCFWGLSGILMWWQIKSTRWIGLATVALGLMAALGLAAGMHFAMTS